LVSLVDGSIGGVPAATRQELAPRQRADGIAWRWQEGYAELRYEAEVLGDLLGCLPKSAALLSSLRRLEALPDPLLKLWATVSLLRVGEKPDNASATTVASDAETRNLLLDKLAELRRRDLFPASELTQAKLAESDMVRWLVSPPRWGAHRITSS
jgi:hypothetical protein